MTYQVTYETADGTVEGYTCETNKARAVKTARNAAKTSAINEPLQVSRWFVETEGLTVAIFEVAA